MDTEFQAEDFGFQSLSVELGFWIPIVSEIPDSMSCILDSEAQDSGFHKQIFPDSGIENPLHWAKLFCYFNECRP